MNRKILILVIAILVIANISYTQRKVTDIKLGAATTNGNYKSPIIYGDIDNDGQITSYDAYNALRMSVGYTSSPFAPIFSYTQLLFQQADVDGDHAYGTKSGPYAVSTYDTYLILRRSVGVSDPFPVETMVVTPSVPTLVSPVTDATDLTTSLRLTWSSSTNATSYTLQVSANSSFTTFFYNQSGLTGTSQVVSGLNPLTKYYWRVCAANSYGSSNFTSSWNFTTTGAQPAAPSLVSPANYSESAPLSNTLRWNASPTATSYTLQVSTSSTFSSLVFYEYGITSTQKIVGGLDNQTQYYWRVNASNGYGTSAFSDFWTFTTIVAPPAAPTLVFPADSSLDIPVIVSLTWNESLNATSYNLQVSDNSSFTNIIYSLTDITSNYQLVSGLDNSTKYYWRVNAASIYGTSDWSSPAFSFTTEATIPLPPVLETPVDIASNVSIDPTLTWIASPTATSYRLQIATDEAFTILVFDQLGITDTHQDIVGLANSSRFYWRVNATNSYGTSDWSSPTWSFFTVDPPSPLQKPAKRPK